MMDCGQPQITSSSQKTDGRFRSGSVPANKSASHRPDLVGVQFGRVLVTSPEVIWKDRWRYLQTKCLTCGTEKLIYMNNLLKGKTQGCQKCTKPRRAPIWLTKRLEAARQRCVNRNDPGYPNYGGRGVEWRFTSVTEAAVWLLANAEVRRDWELDRKDNSGHYEIGNVHFTPRRENQNNRRNTVMIEFSDQHIPANDAFHVFRYLHPKVRYADLTLERLMGHGLSEAEIVARWDTPSCKPKGVYGTCSMPDLEIVSRYLAVSSTTAVSKAG